MIHSNQYTQVKSDSLITISQNVQEIVRDSIFYISQQEHQELMQKAIDYYSSSFDKLIGVSAALLTLIGFVLPLINHRRDQKESTILENRRKEMEQDFKVYRRELKILKLRSEKEMQILSAKNEKTIKEIEANFKKEKENIELKMVLIEQYSAGSLHHLQGSINRTNKYYERAINQYLYAIKHYFIGHKSGIANAIGNIQGIIESEKNNNVLKLEMFDLIKLKQEIENKSKELKMFNSKEIDDLFKELQAVFEELREPLN